MATVIKSITALKKIIELRIKKALEMTQDDIWDAVRFHIEVYYEEYTPKQYERTRRFAESLIRTEVIRDKNGLSCTVEIDPDYLRYTYNGEPSQPHIPHYNPATGYDVATWANHQSHGGIYDDDFGRFWNDAMQDLGLKPGILAIMKDNLRKCGVPVK